MESQFRCFLRRFSKSVSPCQSQHQSVRPYGQQQLKPVISGATSSVISPNHIVESGIPEVYIPDVTLDEYIWANVDKWSDKIAMECGLSGRKYTYGQCRLMTRRFASALLKSGMKPGDVIAMVLPNVPEFPVAFLGANAAGLSVTLINPLYTPDEISKQLLDAEVKAVVTISMFVPLVKAASASAQISLKNLIVIGEAEEGCHTFMSMVKDDGSAYPKHARRDPKEEIAALPYSSGTTGKPKGVMLSHYNMVANICEGVVSDWCNFHETTYDFQEVFGVVLPFFHIYSLNAILLGGLSVGAKVVCLPKFDPDMYIKMLADYKPTFLHTVPPLLGFVATNPEIKNKYLERAHTIICGGAPAGRVLIEKTLERFSFSNPLFQEGFGMTETSPVVCMLKTTSGISKLGSCGTPIPMTQVAVVDIGTGESLGPNKTGELYIRGPQVAPSELEDLLRKHPKVLDCAVIGVPDEASGELPRAYIVGRPNVSISETDIHSYVEDKVAAYKQLKGGVHFVESIPKNPSGKILRKDLKAAALGL
ncbi:unnamed protein product [Allacma fusca]|uniref:4-coumarate--CoA ligase n=1 Tax=Allacma fusca TaxID=39272 RepID=A0A8J2KVG1_9HEXA|nr:unnamed protein product [Allacma fusca]